MRAFLAILDHRSFRKATDELGVSPSTLSHIMRALKTEMAVRLLHRTTRSVAPTQAGQGLAARLRPVLGDLDAALRQVEVFRDAPSGTPRLNASELAARLLIRSVVPRFLARYPAVTLDLVTDGRLIDIVAEGIDAGVRLGEAVPSDMIAARFGGEARFVTVASPAYLAAREPPLTPDGLADHPCIRVRLPSGKPYRRKFAKYGQERALEVRDPLTLDHTEPKIKAAEAGLGIAYVSEHAARAASGRGTLRIVLDDWCLPTPGVFLYHPSRRHVPAGLRAFIDVLTGTRARPPTHQLIRVDPGTLKRTT